MLYLNPNCGKFENHSEKLKVCLFLFRVQYFSPNVCRCECTDRSAIAACFAEDDGRGLKVWDAVNCRCRCAQSYRECSSGYIYDQTDTCR